MTTLDWWRAVVQSARWSAVICACLLAWAIVMFVELFGLDERVVLAGALGRVLVALSLAFVADDVATLAAPAVPTTARSRFLARAAIGIPTLAVGWMGVALIESAVASGPVLLDPLAAITLAGGALGLAVAVTRRYDVPSPGAVGASATALIAAAAALAPARWAGLVPDQPMVAAVVFFLLVVSVWTSTAEPAR